MDRKVLHIAITPGSVVTTLLVLVGAVLLYYLRDLALLVLTAIVIASSIEPGVTFFIHRAQMPRVLSVVVMYVLVFGFIFAAIYFFLPPILEQAQAFLALLPQYLNTIELPNSIQQTSFLAQEAGNTQASIVDSLVALRESFASTGSGIVQLLATIFGGIFSLVLTIVLSFYFAVQDTGIDDFLRVITPVKRQAYVLDLWRRSQRKIGLWMQGQLILSLIVGVLIYLGLMILGVPYAFLLASFAAFAELIPVFGGLLAAVPGIAIAFTTGGVTLALIVTGLFLVVNQFQSHLIYPLVVKKVIGVPPLLVILALIAGGQLAGFLGVILSVPIAAVVQEFITDVQRNKQKVAR